MILAALLDTLVDLATALGLLVSGLLIAIWAWVGIEQVGLYLARRRCWNQIKKARRDLSEDEAVADIRRRHAQREYVAGRRSA